MVPTTIVVMFLLGVSLDGGCQCVDPALEDSQGRRIVDATQDEANGDGTLDGAAKNDGSLSGDLPTDPAGADASVVIAAAGDIACAGCAQGATAHLLEGLLRVPGLAAVLPLGDDAYQRGSVSEFERFYRPTWGRPELLAITHPTPGNHEYADGTATGYFDFFDGIGQATGIAGRRGAGYYSFDLAGWHLIALNTSDECRWVSCAAGSPQHQWLLADLAAHPARCTLAFWHHPRFQAGAISGEATAAAPLWNALFDAGADVVLNGHEHGYQQLAPLDKSGAIDRARGIRTFIVGTGGGDFDTRFAGPHVSALETTIVKTHGILELTLRPNAYDWRFISVGGGSPAAASGSSACH